MKILETAENNLSGSNTGRMGVYGLLPAHLLRIGWQPTTSSLIHAAASFSIITSSQTDSPPSKTYYYLPWPSARLADRSLVPQLPSVPPVETSRLRYQPKCVAPCPGIYLMVLFCWLSCKGTFRSYCVLKGLTQDYADGSTHCFRTGKG